MNKGASAWGWVGRGRSTSFVGGIGSLLRRRRRRRRRRRVLWFGVAGTSVAVLRRRLRRRRRRCGDGGGADDVDDSSGGVLGLEILVHLPVGSGLFCFCSAKYGYVTSRTTVVELL